MLLDKKGKCKRNFKVKNSLIYDMYFLAKNYKKGLALPTNKASNSSTLLSYRSCILILSSLFLTGSRLQVATTDENAVLYVRQSLANVYDIARKYAVKKGVALLVGERIYYTNAKKFLFQVCFTQHILLRFAYDFNVNTATSFDIC